MLLRYTTIMTICATLGAVQPTGSALPDKDNSALAYCLVEKDVKFFSAYWCGPCKVQKQILGEQATHILMEKGAYVECSDRSTREQMEQCEAKPRVSGLPTWQFGTPQHRLVGTQDLETLAEHSGCQKP